MQRQPMERRRESALGKGEVLSSILSGSTIPMFAWLLDVRNHAMNGNSPRKAAGPLLANAGSFFQRPKVRCNLGR